MRGVVKDAALTCPGSWSDRQGRQYNMLLGIASIMVLNSGQLLVTSFHVLAPLWITLITNAISGAATLHKCAVVHAANAAGAMGTYWNTYTNGQAYQADIVADKSQLTFRFNIVAVIRQLGTIIGASLRQCSC